MQPSHVGWGEAKKLRQEETVPGSKGGDRGYTSLPGRRSFVGTELFMRNKVGVDEEAAWVPLGEEFCQHLAQLAP